jgi:hypothetical protein
LRRQPKLKASVIWERLVAEHGFQGHYQRVKVYVRENRARLTQAEPEPVGFHRAQVHRTHGEVIGVRAERDRAALRPLPEQPYVVCDRHTRRVGKDALVSFAASHYSVPWRRVRPGGRVELRVTPTQVAVWSLGPSQELLATHARALQRGGWVVDQTHWDGLPDRATAQPLLPCTRDCELIPHPSRSSASSSCPGSPAGPSSRPPGCWSPTVLWPPTTTPAVSPEGLDE